MTTGLQEEHIITEEITGVDIVKEQICLSDGEKLRCTSNTIRFPRAHSIELHIRAQDTHNNFASCQGRLNKFVLPSGFGLRVDSEFKEGDIVKPEISDNLATITVTANNRAQCIARAKRALIDFCIEGVTNNKDYLLNIIEKPGFKDLGYGKDFIEKEMSNY